MPNWNNVKRQLKFDKPMNLFTKTHKPKTKTLLLYDKNNALNIYLKGHCLIFLSAIYQLFVEYFNIK